MPDLNFSVERVEPAARGIAPMLHFHLLISNEPVMEPIQAVLLNAQIQIEAPRRQYNPREKEKLMEIFGKPEQWGNTLRNRFWTHTSTTVHSFTGRTEAILPVPCTFDLNLLSAKYLHALEEGEVPLLFLFSGSVFYVADDGRLQTQRISWEKECRYRMPARQWQGLMEEHFPNSAWLSLRRDLFDRLCEFKREKGLGTWDKTIEELLAQAGCQEVAA